MKLISNSTFAALLLYVESHACSHGFGWAIFLLVFPAPKWLTEKGAPVDKLGFGKFSDDDDNDV